MKLMNPLACGSRFVIGAFGLWAFQAAMTSLRAAELADDDWVIEAETYFPVPEEISVPFHDDGIAIADCASHHLLLKGNGSVLAWGDRTQGQCDVPVEALSGVISVAGGIDYSLALLGNGKVVGWGDNASGTLDIPAAAKTGVIGIAASSHALALKSNGSVIAWGDDYYGQCKVPAAARSGVVAIAAGRYHSLALKKDGSVTAWGADDPNGEEDLGQAIVPTLAKSGVKAIAAGTSFSVALKQDGSVVTWGGLEHVPAEAWSGVVAVNAGHDHILALKSDGSVIAWGGNDFGQTDVPAEALGDIAGMAAGRHRSMVLKTDGRIICWGRDESGNPPVATSDIPAMEIGEHSLAITWDKRLLAWGKNDLGQAETPPDAASGIVAISRGYAHSMALRSDGRVVAWGAGTELGLTVPNWRQSRVPTEALAGIVDIAAGDVHSLALTAEGEVIGWGYGYFSYYENYETYPVPPAAKSGVVDIAAGQHSSMALKNDGSVITWGSQTRDGSTPSSVASGVSAIACNRLFMFAVRSGRVVAWAHSGFEALVPDDALAGVVDVAASGYYAYALKGDGTVLCWDYSFDSNSDPVVHLLPAQTRAGIAAIEEAGDGVRLQVSPFHAFELKTPNGGVLNPDSPVLNFGKTAIGSQRTINLTLSNTGTREISPVSFSPTNGKIGDFTVTQMPARNLAAGADTLLSVRYTPTRTGQTLRTLSLTPGGADGGAIVLQLKGLGEPAPEPEISIEQPFGKSLISGKSKRDFGRIRIGKKGKAVAFKIRNKGTSSLTGISVRIKGSHQKDFLLKAPKRKSLAVGKSVTFKVYFKPGAISVRNAKLFVTSNDADENPFIVKLSGIGKD